VRAQLLARDQTRLSNSDAGREAAAVHVFVERCGNSALARRRRLVGLSVGVTAVAHESFTAPPEIETGTIGTGGI